MIRITRQTDYGIILLAHLARASGEGAHTARDVAEWSRLPLPMVTKILKLLAREGILVSHRGIKGGYSLAQRPEEISIGDVIEVLEGPFGMTECALSPGTCDLETDCPTRNNWQKISKALRNALDDIPLSEMVTPSHPTTDLLTLGGPG